MFMVFELIMRDFIFLRNFLFFTNFIINAEFDVIIVSYIFKNYLLN